MTYCRMVEVIERYADVTDIYGPSTQFDSNYPYTPGPSPIKGFMAARRSETWGFTARSAPHLLGPTAPDFSGNSFYFLGQISDKTQPETITNKNNNHNSYLHASTTLETIGGKTKKDQCEIREQCAIYSAETNYESYIDFLKILIEELVENLDYDAYVSNTNTFDDVGYGGWEK